MSDLSLLSEPVVSAVLNDPAAISKVMGSVLPADMEGRAAEAYRTILNVVEDGGTPTVDVVSARWVQDGHHVHWGVAAIFEMYQQRVSGAALNYHLDRLVEARALATLSGIGGRLTQMAGSGMGDPAEVGKRIKDELDSALLRLERPSDIEIPTVSDIRAYSMPDQRWVFPGMLKRQQRVMFVAGEGVGKSTLLAQIAFAGAAGMNPFTGMECPPLRTMIVDAENSQDDAYENWKRIDGTMQRMKWPDCGERIAFEPLGRPLDLSKGRDQGWLRVRIEKHRPDLLAIGPLYMLTEESLIDEAAMMRLITFFAHIRSDYDLTLVLESHAGNEASGHIRNLRPYGSSVQRRNMEYGFGLRPMPPEKVKGVNGVIEVESWRGARTRSAQWPTHLRKGTHDDVWFYDHSGQMETWT